VTLRQVGGVLNDPVIQHALRRRGSGTRVDSGSSVDVVMALINIKSPRKNAYSRNGVERHVSALDQYQ